MSASPGLQDAQDLLAEYKAARGVNTQIPGITVAGGFLSLNVQPTPDPPTTSFTGFLGIIVSNEQQVSQLPRPEVDLHADWMWWQTFDFAGISSGPQQLRFDGSQSPMLRWRAKRRMDEIGMSLYVVLTTQGAGTDTHNLIVNVTCSTLLMLP